MFTTQIRKGVREVRIKKDYFCLNTASPFPLRRIDEGANQQREERQCHFPCGEVRAAFEIRDRTIREGIHREGQPGKSGWIFGSAQTGHVG